MDPLGRRRFLALAAAVACAGCADEPDGGGEFGDVQRDDRPVGSDTPSPDVSVAVPALFSGPVEVGRLDDLAGSLATGAMYVPAARAWLVRVPDTEIDAARAEADERQLEGLEHELVALHQRCPHLGCRVPFCESSGWFECPCHGSQFTRLGEHRSGPGSRGMDAFVVRVDDGRVLIDRSELIEGRPAGFVGVEQEPSGPHCLGAGDH